MSLAFGVVNVMSQNLHSIGTLWSLKQCSSNCAAFLKGSMLQRGHWINCRCVFVCSCRAVLDLNFSSHCPQAKGVQLIACFLHRDSLENASPHNLQLTGLAAMLIFIVGQTTLLSQATRANSFKVDNWPPQRCYTLSAFFRAALTLPVCLPQLVHALSLQSDASE